MKPQLDSLTTDRPSVGPQPEYQGDSTTMAHNVVATVKKRTIPLKQVPDTYGIPYSTARQWIREGRLKGYKVPGGRQVYVRVEDIEAIFVQIGGEE